MSASIRKALPRYIDLTRPHETAFLTNAQKTSRYTRLSYLPQALFRQLQRVSNTWFLIVGVIDLVALGSGGSWILGPLVVVALFGLLIDGLRDVKRNKRDLMVNSSKTEIWNGTNFRTVLWKEVKVGDFVLLRDGNESPADIVILATGLANHICFLDTKILTGEQTLLSKRAVKEIGQMIQSEDLESAGLMLNRLVGVVKLGEPSIDFETLDVSIKLSRSPKAEIVTNKNFILRGSVLRLTPWLIGLVAYTGSETKTGLATCGSNRKSRVEYLVNGWTAGLVVFVCVSTAALSLCSLFAAKIMDGSNLAEKVAAIGVLFASVVPISLLVSLEIVGAGQAYMLSRKLQHVSVIDSNALESVGQVEYLFLDPSAFATSRPLVHSFIIGDNEFTRESAELEECSWSEGNVLLGGKLTKDEVNSFRVSEPTTRVSNSFSRMKISISSDSAVQIFFEGLTLCGIRLTDASGNEECIVQNLKSLNCEVLTVSGTICQAKVLNQETTFELISLSEANASCHRTRILVLKTEDSTFRFYIKGSFSVLRPILDLSPKELSTLETKIDNLESKGLTPLLVGYADISIEKLENIRSEFAFAHLSISHAQINTIYERIESEESIKLAGILTISDPSQSKTRQSVQSLMTAGVKMCILSSLSESATSTIAHNVGITHLTEPVVLLKGKHCEDTLQKDLLRCIRLRIENSGKEDSDVCLVDGLNEMLNSRLNELIRIDGERFADTIDTLQCDPSKVDYTIAIDGETIEKALHSRECRRLLAYLVFCANSVCGFGMKNSQKREFVEFVKGNFGFRPVTMAVVSNYSGLSFLRTADIGLSLNRQSAFFESSSDIVIEDVCQIAELLLKYGQRNNIRISQVVLLFLFNSIVIFTVQFSFTLIDDFSGTSLLEPGLVACSSIVFTAIPVIYIGLFDEEKDSDISMLQSTYKQGTAQARLRFVEIAKTLVSGIIQGCLLSVLLYVAAAVIRSDGRTEDFGSLRMLFSIAVVTTSNFHTIAEAKRFDFRLVAISLISVGLLFVYIGLVSISPESDSFAALEILWTSPGSILSMLVTPLSCFTLSLLHVYYRAIFNSPLSLVHTKPQESVSVDPRFRLHQYQSSIERTYNSSFSSKNMKKVNILHPITLRFSSQHIESQYQLHFLKSHLPMLRGLMVLVWILTVVWVIADSLLMNPSISFIMYRVAMSIMFFLLLLLTTTKWFRLYYIWTMLIIISAALVVKVAAELMYSIVGGLAAAMIPMICYIFMNVHIVWVTVLAIGNIILFTISGVIIEANSDPLETAISFLCYEVIILGLTIIAANAGYVLERADRIEYQIRTNTEKEVEKSRSILSLLLPPFVISKVRDREEGKYISEDQGNVTIVFCDIYDFDTICSVYKPNELIAILDDVFRRFDGLCQLNGVAKIETVGKTYMACAGLKYVDLDLPLPLRSISHARRAVEFAFDLLTAAHSIQLKTGHPLQLKIGINSGPVISGVVGYHKPQFSLVGDAVNTASRMCSTIEEVDNIQISAQTKSMMQETWGIEFESKVVYAKGKGEMQTFLVRLEGNGKRLKNGLNFPRYPRNSMESDLYLTKEWSSFIQETPVEKFRMNLCCPLISWKESAEETAFRVGVYSQTRQIAKWNSVSTIVIQLMLFGLRVTQWVLLPKFVTWEVLLAYGLLVVFPLFCLLIPKKIQHSRVYGWIQIPFFIAVNWLVLIDFVFATDYLQELIAIEVMNIYLLSTWAGLHFFKSSTVLGIAVALSWVGMIGYAKKPDVHLIQLIFIVIYALINNYAIYCRERHMRDFKHLKTTEDREILKNDRLLEQMMPKSVYYKLNEDLPVADKLLNITILFADIVGFTNWSSDKSPEQVVKMLSALFTQFDLLCVRLKIYKVHTIGDCYVVMGFDGASETFDPDIGCLRVLCMGHEMIRIIREVNQREGISLNMRIGIHTGDVIAGITGKDVIRYDIYGPDVMIANKAESGGSPGKVNITEVTREILERVVPSQLNYSPNQEILAQSINKTYMSYFAHPIDIQYLLSLAEFSSTSEIF